MINMERGWDLNLLLLFMELCIYLNEKLPCLYDENLNEKLPCLYDEI